VVIVGDCISDQVKGCLVEEVKYMLVWVKEIVEAEEISFYGLAQHQVLLRKVEDES